MGMKFNAYAFAMQSVLSGHQKVAKRVDRYSLKIYKSLFEKNTF